MYTRQRGFSGMGDVMVDSDPVALVPDTSGGNVETTVALVARLRSMLEENFLWFQGVDGDVRVTEPNLYNGFVGASIFAIKHIPEDTIRYFFASVSATGEDPSPVTSTITDLIANFNAGAAEINSGGDISADGLMLMRAYRADLQTLAILCGVSLQLVELTGSTEPEKQGGSWDDAPPEELNIQYSKPPPVDDKGGAPVNADPMYLSTTAEDVNLTVNPPSSGGVLKWLLIGGIAWMVFH